MGPVREPVSVRLKGHTSHLGLARPHVESVPESKAVQYGFILGE